MRNLQGAEPAWNPADYAEHLKPTSLGPLDGEVKKLAETITAGKTTVLAKTQAVYDWTAENMYRDPDVVPRSAARRSTSTSLTCARCSTRSPRVPRAER